MEVAALVVGGTLGVSGINVISVLLGRQCQTKAARVAFASGLAGLCACPLAFAIALAGFAPAPLDARPPVFLIGCLAILAGATLCSAIVLVPLLRNAGAGPKISSKSTPPHGTA